MQLASGPKLISISDLHLSGKLDPLYRAFLDFLDLHVGTGDVLVLGGDIFDLLLGNKKTFTDEYSEFLEWIRKAGARQVEVHYLEGNHDFYLKPWFKEFPWIKVHESSVEFRLAGKRIWVEHGDLVDTKDYGYRVLRLILRSFVIKRLIDWMPSFVVEWIGGQMSKTSGHFTRKEIPTERLERTRLLHRNAAVKRANDGVDLVIMGHCHLRDDFEFRVGDRAIRYLNVGYPRVDKKGVVWRDDARVDWVELG